MLITIWAIVLFNMPWEKSYENDQKYVGTYVEWLFDWLCMLNNVNESEWIDKFSINQLLIYHSYKYLDVKYCKERHYIRPVKQTHCT